MHVARTTLVAMLDVDAVRALAEEYAELFPQVYLRLHRRDGKRRHLSGASRGVLLHLGQTGPLTIGECAKHLGRAQSVVSEIVEQLEKNGLLARVRDADDRRRTLVWLTDAGRERLVLDQDVLSRAALLDAFGKMNAEERAMLIQGTRALVRASAAATNKRRTATTRRST